MKIKLLYLCLVIIAILSFTIGYEHFFCKRCLHENSYTDFLESFVSSGKCDYSLNVKLPSGEEVSMRSVGQFIANGRVLYEDKDRLMTLIQKLVSRGIFKVSISDYACKVKQSKLRNRSPFVFPSGDTRIMPLVRIELECSGHLYFLFIYPKDLFTREVVDLRDVDDLANVFDIIYDEIRLCEQESKVSVP